MTSSAFHRAVEALERAHRLSLILLVGPNDRAPEAREQLDKLLPLRFHARPYRIDRQGPDILSFAQSLTQSLADPFPILFVHGFERLPSQQREDVEIRLNLLRDAFAQHHLGLIFWLPRDNLESFLQHCPDLFAWRSLLGEVADSELSVSPIIAARREYLSRLLRQPPLLQLPMEIQVKTAGQASLPIGFEEWAVKTKLGLLVGPYGSGKTIALQKLAHRLADHAYDDATQPVPVLFHGEALASYSRFDLDQSWPRGLDSELARDVLSTLAERGQLIILFDGLDEVHPRLRRLLRDWVIQLPQTYPSLRMIVGTRSLNTTLLADIPHEWNIVHITKEELSLHYPLSTQMSLLDHLGSGRLPSLDPRGRARELIQMISRFVDRRLTDFDEATSRYRGVGHARRADVLGYRELRRALQRMALAAMENGTTRISRDQLLSSFAEIPDLFSTDVVRENAEYLLVSRSGLLQEEAGELSFAHTSFQEYLAAEGLAELGVEPALEILGHHVSDLRWTGMVAFTVALLEARSSTGQHLLDLLASYALSIPEARPRAAAFTVVLGTALAVAVWSEMIGDVLQAARLMIEDSSDATYALEPLVDQAMRQHGKIG